jgi:hypothetical protein
MVWQRVWDKEVGDYYYFNQDTGEAVWEKPEDFGDLMLESVEEDGDRADDTTSKKVHALRSHHSATIIQKLARGRRAKRVARDRREQRSVSTNEEEQNDHIEHTFQNPMGRHRQKTIQSAASAEMPSIARSGRSSNSHFSNLVAIVGENKQKLYCFCGSFCCLGLFVFTTVCLPLFFSYVGTEEVGLRVNKYSGAVIDKVAYGPGRYAHGMSQDFIRFKQTVLTVQMIVPSSIYSGKNMKPYPIGKFARQVRGPVTGRARSGERFDVEITLMYKLDKEKLYEIHTHFGSFQNLNESITDLVRSVSRSTLSSFTVTSLLKDRVQIEASMAKALNDILVKENLIFVGLSLGRIVWDSVTNQNLYDQQYYIARTKVAQEQVILDNITGTTTLLTTQAAKYNEKNLSIINAAAQNLYSVKTREIVLIKEKILTLTEKIKARNQINVSLLERDGINAVLNRTSLLIAEEGRLSYEVAVVQTQLQKAEAFHRTSMRAINAVAHSMAVQNISVARYLSSIATIEQKSKNYEHARSVLGMIRSGILKEEWTGLLQRKTATLQRVKRNPNVFDVQIPPKILPPN